MARDFRDNDEGKEVMTADGDHVGSIEEVRGGTAHVKPADDLDQSTRRSLGWTDEGMDTYALDNDTVDRISGNEVHLKRNM